MQPRRVILLVSPAMREHAHWLTAVLEKRISGIQEWPVDDPWDITHIQNQVLELLERETAGVAEKSIALNATGGTKPMSIAAYEAFRAYQLPIFYVHPGYDQLIWLYPEQQAPHELADRIKLEPFLQAHGAMVNTKPGPQRNIPDPRRLEIATEIIRNIDHYQDAIGIVNHLAYSAIKNLRSDKIRNQNTQLRDLIEIFAQGGLLEYQHGCLHFRDEEARFFVNGGWLEYHVFDAVRQQRKRDALIQDIAFGVEVTREERGKAIPNEFDVAFLRNNRLHLIECKTKKFTGEGADAPAADALYKLDSLKELMGGLQARAMLVSYRNFNQAHRRRAADLNIHVCAGHDLQQLQHHLKQFSA